MRTVITLHAARKCFHIDAIKEFLTETSQQCLSSDSLVCKQTHVTIPLPLLLFVLLMPLVAYQSMCVFSRPSLWLAHSAIIFEQQLPLPRQRH